MMEVTPHLKSVLKNYQYSATKSLQGPGLSLIVTKKELLSPEVKEEEFSPPVPQSFPILTAPDTSCSERSETILEGEPISCFIIGGEKRLCLPQVLNSVLRDFRLEQINQECDELQIFCSRCTSDQLNVLKNHGILPSSAHTCGLITKTDAERLCSALLFGQSTQGIRPRKNALSFPVYHECFGEARGTCFPELYTSKHSRCIECHDCQGGFTPQQFVCHVHRNFENRTVHWGFDSSNHWRAYLHVPEEHPEQQQFEKYLDDMRGQYEGKLQFPLPIVDPNIKRKQIPASEIIKDHHANNATSKTSPEHLPLKKQKLEEYFHSLGKTVPPYGLPTAVTAAAAGIVPTVPANIHQIYASMEPSYIQRCLQEFNNVGRHLSAFKPVVQTIREQKLRSANALGLAARCAADPPLLQNPDRVVSMSESERFETSYQPNVALAPPTPKKHRYGRAHELMASSSQQCSTSSTTVVEGGAHSPNKAEPPPPLTNGHVRPEQEKVEAARTPSEKNAIDPSTISVVQTATHSTVLVQNNTNHNSNNNNNNNESKYNPEIELSTDTEDSASETSERNSDFVKLDEVLKGVDVDVREKVFELFKNLSKERERAVVDSRTKEDRISELELKNSQLLEELRTTSGIKNSVNNNIHKSVDAELVTSSSIIQSTEDSKGGACPESSLQTVHPKVLIETQQKSVIASLASINDQQEGLLSTAPE